MRFCKVPVSGQDLLVTIKLSRWRGPDKWAGFVMLHLNCLSSNAKTMTTRASARSPTDSVPEERNSPGGRSLKSGFYAFSHRLWG
jgi:hypothetical protein